MLAITLISVIAGTLALYIGANIIVIGSFAELEEKTVQENVGRTLSALDNEFTDLSSKAGDYAEWDETYDFIQNGNEEYIYTNLDAPTWANLRVDLVVFISTAGQVVYGTAFRDMTTAPLPQSLLDLISANDALWYHPDVASKITGIVPLSEAPLLIASRPILTSSHEGPIRGALIMGCYFDSEEIEYLINTVHLPLSLSHFTDLENNSDSSAVYQALSKKDSIFVQPLNADMVAGYSLLMDVYDDPFLVLRVDMTRDIYKQGEATVTYFLLAQIVTGVVTSAAVLVILEKYVVSRVDRLASDIKDIEKSTRVSEHLSWDSKDKDELSVLAGAIDSMMEARLKAIEQMAAMVGHDLRNPLTGIANAAYYLRMKIGSDLGPKATEMLDIIDKDIEYSNKIVKDLLEYSRAIKLDLSESTPKSIVKEALELVNIPANVQIMDFTEDTPKIKVDIDKMKRTFVNLIKNAVDAMPEGGKLT
ncbi:MAG TPA: CHASE4 domain-containing protein, partial [Candidatus Bathyarchaeia archaeon]